MRRSPGFYDERDSSPAGTQGEIGGKSFDIIQLLLLESDGMAIQSKTGPALTTRQRDQTQSQAAPIRQSFGREVAGRMLPPILAIASVLAVWWALYLVFPRLLPGPVSTFNEAIRLLSDGTFFFHMLQSLRRVFVGAAVAMAFSIAVGIYMGNRSYGRALLPTTRSLRTHYSRFDVGADRSDALRHQ